MGETQFKNNKLKKEDPLKSFTNPYSPCFYLNNTEYKNKQTIQSVIEEILKEDSTIFKNDKNQNKNMSEKDNETQNKNNRHHSYSTSDTRDTQNKNSPYSLFLSSSDENTNKNENEDLIPAKSSSLQSDIRKLYRFKDFIGEGHFGSVRTAYRRNEICMRKLFAVKSISKKKLLAKDLDDLIREVDIISSLDHPCIIKFYETFHDEYYFHIITELCRGKDLHARVKSEGGKIKENSARIIIMKILNAINYCHSFDIVHRDLKPENIIFESPYDYEEDEKGEEEEENEENKKLFCLKIIDFGLSIKKKREEILHTVLGTPYYMAPEVLKGKYNENCDIWSIGAIAYYILSGHVPFNGKSNSEVFAKIVYDEPSFNYFNGVSKLAIDFIKKCFIKNPNERISCKEALRHPWFEVLYKKINSKEFCDENILYNISHFEKYSKLKKIVVKYLINNMGHVELHAYKKAFFVFDIQRTGVITSEEIRTVFARYRKIITDKQIKNIMSVADDPTKNYLTFSEFIMCSIELRDFLTPGKLLNAFNFFDMDCNSFIDINDINNTLLRWGKDVINKQDIEKIINEITQGQDNKISLEHFLNIFSKEINTSEYLKEINKIKAENEKQIQLRKAKNTELDYKK